MTDVEKKTETTETKRTKVALVTGANKGIGYEIVKQMIAGKEYKEFTILLGARSDKNGKEAIEKLMKETDLATTKNVSLIAIDLEDEKSITTAAAHVKETYGGLDVLINNAGMAFKGDAFDETVAKTTIGVNYHGTYNVCQNFFPLLRENGRVMHVSSTAGQSALKKMDAKWRDQFLSETATKAKIDELCNQFISDVKENKWEAQGWPKSCYGMSKAALTSLTIVQARENKISGVSINACCPGWCRTDMAGDKAPLSAEEGGRRVLASTFLPEGDKTTGKFFSAAKVADFA